MSLLAEKRRSTVGRAPGARRWPVTADTAPATVPPAVIGALAALAADGPVALAGLAVAAACGLAAAGFAALDTHRAGGGR